MRYTDFSDDMISDVLQGRRALTADERHFLLVDTPCFEGCDRELASQLATMCDADLMRTAYGFWADYAQGQL